MADKSPDTKERPVGTLRPIKRTTAPNPAMPVIAFEPLDPDVNKPIGLVRGMPPFPYGVEPKYTAPIPARLIYAKKPGLGYS